MIRRSSCFLITIFFFTATASAQQAPYNSERISTGQAGSIRGMVHDKDFNASLAAAQVLVVETGDKVTATDEGNFVFGQLPPGKYTLIFSKEGYTRQVESNVVVTAGQMTEIDASLSGEFTEMEEFVVQDLQIGGTEAGLLMLRVQSSALLDSISSSLISQAGAGDAASALKLVAGATVQDGKYAVIRGLPDRYVNSQMNGVRLPSADADKRAVQLDQFPSEMIDSVQVSKTFTPDQQGDASGGAVNVVLKGIPDEKVFKVKGGSTYNPQVWKNRDEFLTYKSGGVNFWGKDNGGRDIPTTGPTNAGSFGSIGVSKGDAPIPYNASFSAGGKKELPFDIKVGGFASGYYKRYSSYYNNGVDDSYWVEHPGDKTMAPMEKQVNGGMGDDFKTALYNVTKGTQGVQLGGLGTIGVETQNHKVNLVYMYTRVADDTATLNEDTRGKNYFFPGYNPNDPHDPGNQVRTEAPYIRTETLQYTERKTTTAQLNGQHNIEIPEIGLKGFLSLMSPKIDWTFARSTSELNQPDKTLFASYWWGPQFSPGFPPFVPPGTDPARFLPYEPSQSGSLGNLDKIWKDITEKSSQYFVNWKFPFEQWSGDEGYVKLGIFHDDVMRKYNQESFSNGGDNSTFVANFDQFWSEVFPSQNHPIFASNVDVDYEGKQDISAWYYMADLPLWSFVKLIGGIRYETTELKIVNSPESDVNWIPNGSNAEVKLNPGDADVSFKQKDILPARGFEIKPFDKVTLRGSYTQTVARQTFKELSPIEQQEYPGADIFIGNPVLKMSALKNYDVRFDYNPYTGGLLSYSWFHKDIKNPIEYVQDGTGSFGFITPRNYPHGMLTGFEVETRQQLGHFWEKLNGLSVGGNVTFIHSKVELPQSEIDHLADPGTKVDMKTRDMSNAPHHLYNVYITYNYEPSGTTLGAFYTVKGDTLIAGAGINGHFIPNVYEKEYATLNLSLDQKIGKSFKLTLQAKNILNPRIQTIYRDAGLSEDVVKTSYTKGVDYSLSLSGQW